ncbi:hypothetical protein Tco_0272090 [Tanacetum coccineum]
MRPTYEKRDVWSNYDMCIMIDGVEKARCKKCMKFYNPGSNSTLRTHKSGCNAVSENDTSQGTIGADGQVFIFDNDAVRLDFTKFVIQQALPFNHFDNVKLTEIIKRRLQPRIISEMKDYLDGVDRVQHETSLEGPILEDVEETIAREEVELGISPPNTRINEREFRLGMGGSVQCRIAVMLGVGELVWGCDWDVGEPMLGRGWVRQVRWVGAGGHFYLDHRMDLPLAVDANSGEFSVQEFFSLVKRGCILLEDGDIRI